MINNGEKSKPLDRYPYMENELKKYDTMQDDIKKLQGDVQEIDEVLNTLTENVINLNNIVENLTEVTQYKDFFTLVAKIDYLEIVACTAYKVGNSVQIYLQLKITKIPQRWDNNIGNLDYSIVPTPIKMFSLVDIRFLAKVSTTTGLITLVAINNDFIQVDRLITLTGFYVIDVGGA